MVPDQNWPKTSRSIQGEIDAALEGQISEMIYVASVIHHAPDKQLPNKAEWLEKWKKAYDAMIDFDKFRKGE